ncbi:hypothetical protein D3C81_1354610 [compost metagenome]
MDAMAAHPVTAVGRGADGQPGQPFVSQPAGDLEQILPVLLLGVGIDQHVLRRVMHATQVTGVLGVAAAPFARGGFEQHHAGAGLAGHQRGAQGGIAAANHKDVDHGRAPFREG